MTPEDVKKLCYGGKLHGNEEQRTAALRILRSLPDKLLERLSPRVSGWRDKILEENS